MAEDQSEPGVEAAAKSEQQPLTLPEDAKPEVDPKPEEALAGEDKEKPEKPAKVPPDEKVDPVKETSVDEDPEGSQSLDLVLEDCEENEAAPTADEIEVDVNSAENTEEVKTDVTEKKEEELKDLKTEEPAQKQVEVDEKDVPPKPDGNEKEKTETVEETEKVEKSDKTVVDTEKSDKLPSPQIIEEVKDVPEDNNPEEQSTKEAENEEKPALSEPTKEETKPKPVEEKKGTEPAEDVVESEVGIVGPPTAASELLSDAELVGERPALPTDETKAVVSERVVRWVENAAAKADDPAPGVEDEPGNEAAGDVEAENDAEEVDEVKPGTRGRRRRRRHSGGTNGTAAPAPRKSQKVVTNIIRRSIRCLNKMHAMESGNGNGKKAADSEAKREPDDEESRKSPKVPQSQQNGAALPEETASADRNLAHATTATASPLKKEKKEPLADEPSQLLGKSKLQSELTTAPTKHSGRPPSQRTAAAKLLQQQQQQQQQQQLEEPPSRETRKRRSTEASLGAAGVASNGSSSPKKLCLDQREQFINSLIGTEKFTAEQLAVRAEQLRTEVQDLDELARAKEMEWNEILSMRKLKEEAYLRIERRRQIMGFMESNGPLGSDAFIPPASLALGQQNYDGGGAGMLGKDSKGLVVPKEERRDSASREPSPAHKRERASKAHSNYQQPPSRQLENGPRQVVGAQSPEHRQIGEGRQGPIVDVRSIIADYRLRHPETVPRRRGRRMRNSVNVGLGAGGAVVETMGTLDSRPSSTDSCKSNSNINDPNNAMSFKDVLVQFAKLSQQQGEPIKTPQNYPDVTLHPVAAAPTTQNSTPQPSGSLLHGILTKSQSPRPTTFSPTLARLLTAPERERSAPTITATPHQTATQHLLQAYQGANPVSISDFLSSSKARTEITITPVVNNPIQTHSNNLIHVDDVEEETSIIEERDSRLSMGNRDNRDDRDTPPRCQGCHERAAQFVCAGCGNQWYCSRECQVAAWDEHSEVCSG